MAQNYDQPVKLYFEAFLNHSPVGLYWLVTLHSCLLIDSGTGWFAPEMILVSCSCSGVHFLRKTHLLHLLICVQMPWNVKLSLACSTEVWKTLKHVFTMQRIKTDIQSRQKKLFIQERYPNAKFSSQMFYIQQ